MSVFKKMNNVMELLIRILLLSDCILRNKLHTLPTLYKIIKIDPKCIHKKYTTKKRILYIKNPLGKFTKHFCNVTFHGRVVLL